MGHSGTSRNIARARVAALVLVVFVVVAAGSSHGQPLEGTKPLEAQGDLASEMVAGIDRFLLREIAQSVETRKAYWTRDTSSPEKYEASVAPNRARLAKVLGVVDARVQDTAPQYLAGPGRSSLVGRGERYEIHAVRWEALPGIHGEGLLLTPKDGKPVADVVALPDADQTPEMIAGLADGVAAESQFARHMAQIGCRVLVPALVDRADTYSVAANGARPTNQPHREFVYRPAFEMGRHVIGYEIQKVLAAVDWFASDAARGGRPIGVAGYGEGGLIALNAGALDTRIDVVAVSGHFGPREALWQEPIYRNVFGLLREFGDAEVASLIAPRILVVRPFEAPNISGPPAARDNRHGAAPGAIRTPAKADVAREVERSKELVAGLTRPGRDGQPRPAGARLDDEPGGIFRDLGRGQQAVSSAAPERLLPASFDSQARLKRQVDEMSAFTQALVRNSDNVRAALWARADRQSRDVAKWRETTKPLREHFYNEVIGRFDHELLAANPRTRKVYDEPKYTGYEVMLDVWPDVFAYGILLVPKDLKPGERRPVVVCQHGLEGRPQDVADPKVNNPAYNQYACKLAERGFITYAPQNPYIFTDRFRNIQLKSNSLGKHLFSFIIPQHEQTLNWLSALPFVDPDRIAFYGLSYGGKTAMRVPAVLERYCLSICSADFNEWIWKNTSLSYTGSYVGTGEYEIFEWDLGNTYNYAEMAGLIAPRPFMVERGHRDGVAPDEWVAYEYAKVRLLYADLKIPERTTIEFFDGPHTIHGVGTFDFLHAHLKWPKP
jgi:dienelactone hydrolase